jgi:hypothetical protein
MHAKEADTINTLRTHFKIRVNVFSWRESGDKYLTDCDNTKRAHYFCIVFSLETVV